MKTTASLLVIASLISAPVTASVRDAAFTSSSDRVETRTSMFVGATYRVRLKPASGKAAGRGSLKIAGMAMAPGSSEIRFGQGLELAGGQSGKPAFLIAGQDIGQLERRSNLSTGATIAIGLGVLLVAGVVVLAATCDNDCENAKAE